MFTTCCECCQLLLVLSLLVYRTGNANTQNSSFVLASILSKLIVGFLSSTLILGWGAVGGGLKMLGMVLSMIFSLSLTRDGRTHSKVYLLPKKKERKKERKHFIGLEDRSIK